VDALLVLPSPLDAAEWLDCLERCPALVVQDPAAIGQRAAALQRLLGGSAADAAAALTKAPYLLLHESSLVEAKVPAGPGGDGRGCCEGAGSRPRMPSSRAGRSAV
jgi:hypothetical protein